MENEISVTENDILEVLILFEEWALVETSDKRRGVIPRAYVIKSEIVSLGDSSSFQKQFSVPPRMSLDDWTPEKLAIFSFDGTSSGRFSLPLLKKFLTFHFQFSFSHTYSLSPRRPACSLFP